ncbi:hypothetical protein ANCDUO_13226 [Ancylostoma duodenale]|uniref:glutathione transferase n=1 Tax=Ancylostoma duodenale TaxID=51022 RepID=A0A0C2GCJ0_9BILA|nr:hypothetical protein ANCDUO_13226 [Ancylostoma duodenale]
MLKWILCMWVQWKMFRETNLKGFAGKSPFEEALVDSIVDQYKDFTVEVLPCLAVLLGFAEGNLEKLTEEVLLPAREKFFGFMTKFLKESNSGMGPKGTKTFSSAELVVVMRFCSETLQSPHSVAKNADKCSDEKTYRASIKTPGTSLFSD